MAKYIVILKRKRDRTTDLTELLSDSLDSDICSKPISWTSSEKDYWEKRRRHEISFQNYFVMQKKSQRTMVSSVESTFCNHPLKSPLHNFYLSENAYKAFEGLSSCA